MNIFVDVTEQDEAPYLAQHQSMFPGNVIARFVVAGRTYLKVPYRDGQKLPVGLTSETMRALMPPDPYG